MTGKKLRSNCMLYGARVLESLDKSRIVWVVEWIDLARLVVVTSTWPVFGCQRYKLERTAPFFPIGDCQTIPIVQQIERIQWSTWIEQDVCETSSNIKSFSLEGKRSGNRPTWRMHLFVSQLTSFSVNSCRIGVVTVLSRNALVVLTYQLIDGYFTLFFFKKSIFYVGYIWTWCLLRYNVSS